MKVPLNCSYRLSFNSRSGKTGSTMRMEEDYGSFNSCVCINEMVTHSWMPLMRVPNNPIMPRNSTRLWFFTVCSWHTLEMA